MNPPATLGRRSAGPAATPLRRRGASLTLGLAAATSVMLLVTLIPSAHFVERVTVINPTSYDLLIEVSDGHGDGWLTLGVAESENSTNIGEVYDRGRQWTFRFIAQTMNGGRLTITRAELQRTNWRVEIPAAVGDTLSEAGAPLPP